ncbi:MAG: trypsin-like peptidase domain-containing protein [Acidobacteriota bacterium]
MDRHLIRLTPASVAILLALSSASFLPARAQGVSEGQRLAMRAKPSVVRIVDGWSAEFVWPPTGKVYAFSVWSKGSGAFINPNGYIVTNAHVTESTHAGEAKGREMMFRYFVRYLARDYRKDPDAVLNNGSMVYAISQKAVLRSLTSIHVVITPDGSAFPFEIKAFGAPIGQGKDVSIIKIEVKNAPVLKFGDSDKVQLQDHISVFGYPAAADTEEGGALSKESFLEASITDGRISARKNSSDGAPVLQVSAPATHGNSGGPVLNDKGEVIGLLTFRGDKVGGQEVSGFSFIVPTSTVTEFVRQAGTTNEEGLVDRRYREGLELYWDGSYSKAIARLEEVKRLFPQHSEVSRLIRDSQQAIAEGKEKSWMFSPVGLVVVGGGALLFLLVAGGGVVFLVMLMRKKPKPTEPSLAHAPSQQPASHMQGGPAAAHSRPPYAGSGKPLQAPAMSATAAAAKTASLSLGSITCTSGTLDGKRFEITPEGIFIGRDGSLSQIVITDERVSKRHVWIGPRKGQVVATDQGSTNGTFLNSLGSARIQEVPLNPGETLIICAADVARFVYQA